MAQRVGTVERGVLADLRDLPARYREGGQAKAALVIARLLDHPATETKDVAGLTRELRTLLTGIAAAAPRKEDADGVSQIRDQLAARRATKTAGG